jgi:hypothetical protein
MRLVQVTLESKLAIAINPDCISHLQPFDGGRPGCMLFMTGDNLPTNLLDDPVELQAEINDALAGSDAEVLSALHTDWVQHATDLIVEIRHLQWAFGISALAFIILLLIVIGRSH